MAPLGTDGQSPRRKIRGNSGLRARVAWHEVGETVIEISDLYKYFGDHRAIGPITTTIDEGQVVGLLGLNGAGKTTTLRILACDLLPTSGTVRIDGVDVVDDPHRVRSMVGYLPETPPLYNEMRVGEYLRFAARLRGLDGKTAEIRVAEVVEQVELARVVSDPIATLSHGFRQRIGIAQAIVHRPRLVVLDEPISGLDPVQIVEMRRLVQNLRERHTVVISSHILSEISETCDRILMVGRGTIVASGTEQELAERFAEGVVIEISLTGSLPIPELKAILSAHPEVVSVESVKARESGIDTMSFSILARSDCRANLARLILEKGLGLLELRRGERELENIFLQLLDGERHPRSVLPVEETQS